MAKIYFNKVFNSKDVGRIVQPNEVVDITLQRADEIVEEYRALAQNNALYSDYRTFDYERVHDAGAAKDDAKDD